MGVNKMANPVGLIAAVLVVFLANVLGGMIPGQMIGDVQLAFWLASLLSGVFTYAFFASVTSR